MTQVIDPSKKETEIWLLNLCRDVPDAKNITLDKFKEIVNAFAKEQNKSMEEMNDRLARQIPAILEQVDSCPGIYVAIPGSEILSMFSPVTINSDISTITDYSELLKQDSSGEVTVGDDEGAVSNGVATGSQGEVAAGSQGDIVDCNLQIISGNQAQVSDDSPDPAS
ncbi:hypothetical protein HW555_012437 [Spodoptera exigua]|uniref:Uncharacterized protein n=1 Tax=Spodoptera exigua TaxID=7107 RepID=A0A835G7H2_SPOEX|nr:hypothetical protein HW555_012437 [Spodoptera exigua]